MLTFDDLCRNRKEEQEGFRAQNDVFYLFLDLCHKEWKRAVRRRRISCPERGLLFLL